MNNERLVRRYLIGMGSDPGTFLSTIILASAGLVAIIGGLLVARFVGLDTDERSNRRVLMDAASRLASSSPSRGRRPLQLARLGCSELPQ